MKIAALARISVRRWAAMLLAFTVWHVAAAQDMEPEAAGLHWVGTWSAAPQQPWYNGAPLASGFYRQTLREIVHMSIGGSRVRVRFTNAHGQAPLQIGAAHVALRSSGAATVPDSDRALVFGGKSGVIIAPGAAALSDPVNLEVPPRSDVAVSIYLPVATGLPTLHFRSRQTNYVSPKGNFTGAASMPVASQGRSTGTSPSVKHGRWREISSIETACSSDIELTRKDRLHIYSRACCARY